MLDPLLIKHEISFDVLASKESEFDALWEKAESVEEDKVIPVLIADRGAKVGEKAELFSIKASSVSEDLSKGEKVGLNIDAVEARSSVRGEIKSTALTEPGINIFTLSPAPQSGINSESFDLSNTDWITGIPQTPAGRTPSAPWGVVMQIDLLQDWGTIPSIEIQFQGATSSGSVWVQVGDTLTIASRPNSLLCCNLLARVPGSLSQVRLRARGTGGVGTPHFSAAMSFIVP